MAKELDVLETAIIETEREIAAEAWDKEAVELDNDGDRTMESLGDGLEGQHEADEGEEAESETGEEGEGETGEAGEAQAKPGEDGKPKPEEAAAAKPGKPEPTIPPGRLREANERARAAETERDKLKAENATALAASRKEVDELKAKFDGVLAALQRQQPVQQQPQQQPEADKVPDLFEDPKGFVDHLTKGFTSELSKRDQQMEALRVETSLQMAHAIHKEAFDKAYEAVAKLDPRNPDHQMTVRRIYAAPNPGEALVDWHKRNETLRVVGDDPTKYRETVAAEVRQALLADPEFRKQVIADLRAEATGGNDGKPNTITRLPKSLNGVAGGARESVGSEVFDGSPQAIAESAWR
jgi:hypothetical protein